MRHLLRARDEINAAMAALRDFESETDHEWEPPK
jgi:hypothetical protein